MPKVVKSINIEKTYDKNEDLVLYDERLTDNNCNVIRRSVIVEKKEEKPEKRRQSMIARMDTSHFETGFSNFYNIRYNPRRRDSAYLPMMNDRELKAMHDKNEKLDIIRKAKALKQVSDTAKRVVREKNLNESLQRGNCY